MNLKGLRKNKRTYKNKKQLENLSLIAKFLKIINNSTIFLFYFILKYDGVR